MAYFGGIFFANMGGGGGRNYSQCLSAAVIAAISHQSPEDIYD